MKFNFRNVQQVSTYRLCIGCGACYSICPKNNIRLINILNDGIRPFLIDPNCNDCDSCLAVCPGIDSFVETNHHQSSLPNLDENSYWGPFYEIWEGFASDPTIRMKGSSGGLCTALSLFCLDYKHAGGVLHIGSNPEIPYLNSTFRSTSRNELEARTGSRYSPASPCDSFKLIEDANDKSVFIGKPCDVAALRKAQNISQRLSDKCNLAIGFFCAGTPSTCGTLELIESLKNSPSNVQSIRYRGKGWPGRATFHLRNKEDGPITLSYSESWGFLQKYRPFRCYLCPDLTSEFADISVGDPWYREIKESEPGRSLILIRSNLGKDIFRQAMENGYVKAQKVDPEILLLSQSNLLGKRKHIWGRQFAMKIAGIPYPELGGFDLFHNWSELKISAKAKSILGTLRRIIRRKYYKPKDFTADLNIK